MLSLLPIARGPPPQKGNVWREKKNLGLVAVFACVRRTENEDVCARCRTVLYVRRVWYRVRGERILSASTSLSLSLFLQSSLERRRKEAIGSLRGREGPSPRQEGVSLSLPHPFAAPVNSSFFFSSFRLGIERRGRDGRWRSRLRRLNHATLPYVVVPLEEEEEIRGVAFASPFLLLFSSFLLFSPGCLRGEERLRSQHARSSLSFSPPRPSSKGLILLVVDDLSNPPAVL